MANKRKANEKIFLIKPLLVLQDERLSPIEQDFICLIAQLQRAGSCTASNNYFAWFFKMRRRNAIRVLTGLKQRVFIGSTEKKQGGKTIERTLGIIDEDCRKNLQLDSVKPTPMDSAKMTPIGLVSKMDSVSVKSSTHTIDKTIDTNKDTLHLSNLLAELIIKRKPDNLETLPERKVVTLRRWASDIDKMIRLDHRKPERIEEVIRWCQKDTFWQANILSAKTLREKFDKLELQMERNGTGRKHRQDTQYEVPADYAAEAIEVG